MGFNTTIVIHNDALGELKENPDIGKRLFHKILQAGTGRKENEVPRWQRSFGPGFVVETHHADDTALIAVGGNDATILHMSRHSHHTEEHQIELLREWADRLGYRISKKPGKKAP